METQHFILSNSIHKFNQHQNLHHSYIEDLSENPISFDNTTEQTATTSHHSNDSNNHLSNSSEDANVLDINNLLQIETIYEATNFKDNNVHKLWGMLKLEVPTETTSRNNVSNSSNLDVDFVVVIDHSSSMSTNNKLAFVQATIEYFISQLSENQRFCLVKFNQDVVVMTEGLLPMNSDNKSKVLALLRQVKPEGTTNISDALFTAITMLNDRQTSEQNRISSIMLFTDGLANAGLCGKKFMTSLHSTVIPVGLTINTFGYGMDHDSNMLQNIAFFSKGGVYYYIETVESIAATFGECLAGILSTVVHNIQVRLIGQDGCRLVNFYTKFPIIENKSVKDYTISMGNMYRQESRSVLFKLSLRKMDCELIKQNLLQVIVSYTETLTGKTHQYDMMSSVSRLRGRSNALPENIPIELDKHINRYTAASAIEGAISKANANDFDGAKKQIEEAIFQVQNSICFKNKSLRESQYCEDLISDLVECAIGMEDTSSYVSGIHYAYAYCTMYFAERSTGTCNLLGIGTIDCHGNNNNNRCNNNFYKNSISSIASSSTSSTLSPCEKKRNTGYGYVTFAQEEESQKAKKEARHYVTGYLENVL